LPFGRSYSCRWTFGLCFLLVKATFNMYRPECVCYISHLRNNYAFIVGYCC